MANKPVLIQDKSPAEEAVSPATAPPVPELGAPAPQGRAMNQAAAYVARPASPLWRWFWRLLVTLFVFGLSLLAWNAVTALLVANPLLGYAATALGVAFGAVCLLVVMTELAALARLRRIDKLRETAERVRSEGDLNGAKKLSEALEGLYRDREGLRWARENLTERQHDQFDAEGVLGLTETELLTPLDHAAQREIENAARQVATVTALVPLALADVVTALATNIRMIRRIAEIYGGRGGVLGNWRLTRAVMTHLVATGAVAVGDDMLGSVAGGSILGRLSRRFGEGVVNGALTARVGVAAIEVCRPLPFYARERPSVSALVRSALTGLFSANGRDAEQTPQK